jgi:hypothetical protein
MTMVPSRMKGSTLLGIARRGGALLAAALVLTSCGCQGIANVPIPGGRAPRRVT